jgi:hypothetical protein
MLLRTIAYFKNTATSYGSVIDRCNELIAQEFGSGLSLGYKPDLLMVAEDRDGAMQGLLILHYTESTRAWDLGTAVIANGPAKEKAYTTMVDGACDAIGVLQTHGILDRVWLVKRVPRSDHARIRFFTQMGFSCPSEWESNFLSDQGYVPFDPFVTALMKREVAPSFQT